MRPLQLGKLSKDILDYGSKFYLRVVTACDGHEQGSSDVMPEICLTMDSLLKRRYPVAYVSSSDHTKAFAAWGTCGRIAKYISP